MGNCLILIMMVKLKTDEDAILRTRMAWLKLMSYYGKMKLKREKISMQDKSCLSECWGIKK